MTALTRCSRTQLPQRGEERSLQALAISVPGFSPAPEPGIMELTSE